MANGNRSSDRPNTLSPRSPDRYGKTQRSKMSPEAVVRAVRECVREAEEARKDRMDQNRRNREVYLGQQDYSHKTEDQSTEFLPKLSEAAEQMSAFFKKGLVGMGDWFTVEVANGPLDGEQTRAVLQFFLQNVNISPYETRDFGTIVGEGVKTGLLESLFTLKVHGCFVEETFWGPLADPISGVETSEPVSQTRKVWKLEVDVIPGDELYLDPSGRNLYKVHRVERDLYEVQMKAESGYYDKTEVKKIVEDMARTDKDAPRASYVNQNESTKPSFRKKVVIDEFWGTLLNEDGSVAHARCWCVVANEKYLLKKPSDYPFWHGEDPFVSAPLIRVPGSVWHKAVYDNAASLNIALNEMYNLMFDGAMAAVWGIRQLHVDWLEDPAQVADGIPPGTTLVLGSGVPPQAKALEAVFTTTVPQDSLAIFNLTNQEFLASAMTNDTRLGAVPQKQVKATELIQAQQSSSLTFDSIISDIENEVIERALRKVWLTLLQNVDDMATEDVVNAVGLDAAFALAQMTPAQRFMAFGNNKFRVHGLSATLAKAGEFQKMMALMQIVGTNPLLLQAFFQKYSPDKVLGAFMKFLNINPYSLQQSPEEQAQQGSNLEQAAQLQQLFGGQQGGSLPGIGGGGGALGADSGLNGEIHQNAEPTGGF